MSSPSPARRIQKRRRPTKTTLQLLDLNSPPAVEEASNGSSLSINEHLSRSHAVSMGATLPSQHSVPPAAAGSNIGTISIPINVDETYDDVVIYSSTRRLPRARQQSNRMIPIVIIDDDSEIPAGPAGLGLGEHVSTLLSLGAFPSHHDRPRASSNNLVMTNILDTPEPSNILPKVAEAPPEPVKEVPMESKFSCPVCMNEMFEASSTVCGHIFCQACIKASVKAQKRCPTCRRKLTMNNFHRVYLPN